MTTLSLLTAIAALGVAAPAPAAGSAGPRTFATPRDGADALVAAAAADDVAALRALFGPEGTALVVSGDEVRDRNDRARFVEDARAKLDVVMDPQDPRRAGIRVGSEGWPFPVPLVEKAGMWSFAVKDGLREVVDRRIGGNELDAIEICRGYVEAQREFAEEDRDGDGTVEYAQRVISTPGKRDGLVWRDADGSLGGPVSERIAQAIAEGYKDKTKPYHGYFFRVLKRQGPSAPLGAMDYVVGGHMIGGFALLAWPAQYRVSGVMTFQVSHDGVVFQKDLGPDTAKLAAKIDRYDPGKGWTAVE